MEATIVMAKCRVTKKSFGIRAEKRDNKWFFTWAFKLSDKSAKNEGYDKTTISGEIKIQYDYPGCTHCGATSFCQCGQCGKILCYPGTGNSVTCPHCGITLEVSEAERFEGISSETF